MKISITRRFTFEAAHRLPSYSGACSRWHGHSYKLDVTIQRQCTIPVEVDDPNERGMVMDFSRMKKIVKENVLDLVDHFCLNDVYAFRPTAENMAADIFRVLNNAFGKEGIDVTNVRLWETEDAYAEVSK